MSRKFLYLGFFSGLILLASFETCLAATQSRQAQIAELTRKTDSLSQEIIDLTQQIKIIQAHKIAQTKKIALVKQPASPAVKPQQALIDGQAGPLVISSLPLTMGGNLTQQSNTLKILQERQKYLQALKKQHLAYPVNPTIQIGGNVAGSAALRRTFLNKNNSDISLAGASLNTAVTLNPWLAGTVKLSYSSEPFNKNHSNTPAYKIANSRIFLPSAMVIIGNLEKFPFYTSFGQMVIPFGFYGNSSPSLASRLGKTLQRAIILGYKQPGGIQGWNLNLYGFRGDSKLAENQPINNGGINLGYIFNASTLKLEFGAGIIANIADSAGIQNTKAPLRSFPVSYESEVIERPVQTINDNDETNDNSHDKDADEAASESYEGSDVEGDEEGYEDYADDELTPIYASTFTGFGQSQATEILAHRVPGINFYSKMTVSDFSITGEYIGASKAFAVSDLNFNNTGARPSAVDLEAAYKFKIFDKNTTLSLGYSQTFEALPLNMPEYRYAIGLKSSIIPNFITSLTYQCDINYTLGNIALGKGAPVLANGSLGRVSNSLTAQFGFTF